MVCLVVNQKEETVKQNQKGIIDCLTKIFDSDPTLIINIESIKPVDDKTEVYYIIYFDVRNLG
jgi:hypothetical protein